MELFGFMDNPGVAGTWSTAPTPNGEVVAGRHTQGSHRARIADEAPSELGAELLEGNFRWSLLVALILIGAGIAALSAWVTQKPVADRAAAIAEVQSRAAELRPPVAEMTTLNQALANAEVNTASVNDTLTRVDGLARQLFTASATLPQAEASTRSRAADASGDALDAVKLLREAYAYRSAVLPVIAAPTLETDPALIEIDEAVRQFGAWQARFDEMRTALPDGFMEKVNAELSSISAQLDTMLRDYVDALRADDASAAAEAAGTLGRRLATAESVLFSSLGDVQTRAQRHIDSSLFALDLLVG
jgi:hypothetical protein